MSKLFNLAALLLTVCTIGLSQTQMNHWYIAPKKMNMTLPTPVPSLISPVFGSAVAATVMQVGNGLYDDAGNLLFYIADGAVYDYNNVLLGAINSGGTEVIIIPFGTNATIPCQRKFNIFSTSGGFTSTTKLWQSVVDMNSFSVTTASIDAITYMGFTATEFGAIAAGKVNGSLDRYLYFLAGPGTINSSFGQINKLVVHNNGSVTPFGQIYPTALNPNFNAGGEVFAQELDLSPDGKWLAWGSYSLVNHPTLGTQYRYHVIELNSTGDYVNNSYKRFNHPGITGNNNVSDFRGVEFWQDATTTKLFIGAGTNGIFSINIPLANYQPLASDFTQIIGSNPNFGNSQIEFAHNNFMYACHGGTSNNVGAFNPAISNPQILAGNSFTLTSPAPPSGSWGSNFYTLPDQIDGQNYSLITPAAVNHVVTSDIINFPANSSNNQTATWTNNSNPLNAISPIYITKEIRIRQNSNLTISGMRFKFSPTAKVIIEPGSTLTLDEQNGTPTVLTSDYNNVDGCDVPYTWLGVEVWGTTLASQNTLPLLQGKLTVKNNSIIEYAKCGATTWRPNYSSYIGGIIIVSSGGTFKNCNVDVEFKPYQNFIILPSGKKILLANKSTFSDAFFINSNIYPFTTAPQHIIIDGCTGLVFSACTFENVSTPLMLAMQSIGIKAIDANFTLTNNSTFTYLWHAIDAKRVTVNKSFSVYHTTFTNNVIGINTSNVNNFFTQLNDFDIGGNSSVYAPTQVGINIQTGSGFTIEENNFHTSVNLTGISKIGISSSSTGSADNQIYKNSFTGITIGNYSTGINRNNLNPTMQGLQYLCNQNSANTDYDFYISNKGGATTGIRLNQGTTGYPAGNTFSQIGPISTPTDFNNTTAAALNYYYKQGVNAQTPFYYNSPKVIPIPLITPINSCLSHIGTGGSGSKLTESEIQQLTNNYDLAESTYLNLLYTYNQLMDGGNTNALLTQIQQSWSTDALILRDELLAMSPYLSQEILRDVANRNILPHAMFLMICMANSDATRNEDFLKYLQFEMTNPLPQYMIDLIISSWDDGTARTTMENMLANNIGQMAFASDRLLADLYFKNAQKEDNLDPNDTTNYSRQINY